MLVCNIGLLFWLTHAASSPVAVSNASVLQKRGEHVTFIALRGDSCPHITTTTTITTIAALHHLIGQVFKQALLVCDAQGLIGREMFANGLT